MNFGMFTYLNTIGNKNEWTATLFNHMDEFLKQNVEQDIKEPMWSDSI